MAHFSTQEKIVAVCKEGTGATRGDQSVVTPTYVPVTGDSNIDYKPTLIEDVNMRGINEPFQPQLGIKEATGTITCDAEPELIGKFLYSLLGKVDTGAAVSGVYPHTFIKKPVTVANHMQHQSLTVHIQRGDDINITNWAYLRSVVKSIVFTGNGIDRLVMANNIIAETEVNSILVDAGSRFSVTWANPVPFMFNETSFVLGDGASTAIRDWSLTIDNMAFGLRNLNASRDIADVLCPGKLLCSGSFTRLFENETERAKFLLNTASSFIVTLTRGATTTLRSITITLPQIHYKAFPFGESEGLLASLVTFDAYYNLPSTTTVTILLKNVVPTY